MTAPSKKRVNSRAKGKRGELELAHRLTELGYPARRGQQRKGGEDSPDVICEGLTEKGFHIECKRTATCKMFSPAQLAQWEAQARADAGRLVPVIIHRWNGSTQWWVCVLPVGIRTLHTRRYWMTIEDWLEDEP